MILTKTCLCPKTIPVSNLFFVLFQLLSVMETSLQKQSVKILQSNLYVLVADLLSFLSMKSPNDSVALDERASEQFNKMLNWFWEGLSCLCLEHVKSINEKVIYSFPSFLCWLLLSLFCSMGWKGEWNHNYHFPSLSYFLTSALGTCIVKFSLLYVGVTRCHRVPPFSLRTSFATVWLVSGRHFAASTQKDRNVMSVCWTVLDIQKNN